MSAKREEEYEATLKYHDSAPVAGKKDGKWGFLGEPDSFIYTDICGHYGSLVGIKEDGSMTVFGRYYTH